MILADKIIRLRRKNGWSQEELAEKMNVSRQAVSKWESAQTVPDLEKILMLGALFGVTTDYLLKDELESEEFTSGEDSAIRRLTLAEANEYLALLKTASVLVQRYFRTVPLVRHSAADPRRAHREPGLRHFGKHRFGRRAYRAVPLYRGGGRGFSLLQL